MILFLAVFLVFCGSGVFCAANDCGDSASVLIQEGPECLVETHEVGWTDSTHVFEQEVRQRFEDNKKVFLSEKELCASHAVGMLYQVIVDLRAQHLNIVHDKGRKTFALFDGVRAEKEGVYEFVAWDMIKKNNDLLSQPNKVLFMDVSDEGFCPDAAKISAVKTLYKLVSGANGHEVFSRRKKIWNIILRDLRLYSAGYYTKRLDVQEPIGRTDMDAMKYCWDIYRKMVTTDIAICGTLAALWEHFSRVGEMTLQDVRDFLSQREVCGEDEVWAHIGLLTLGGYTQHVFYEQGTFLLDTSESDDVETGELLESVCDFADKNMSCDEIAFALHKRGYFYVKPWDVRVILDVLAVCGRINQDGSSREVVAAWNAPSGAQNLQDSAVGNSLRCLACLKKKNLLPKIKQKKYLDIIKVLKSKLPEDYCQNCAGILYNVHLREAPPQEGGGPPKKKCWSGAILYYRQAPQEVSVYGDPGCARERQSVIVRELRRCSGQYVPEQTLQALYGLDAEALLEDIDDLIYAGYNIHYDKGSYLLKEGVLNLAYRDGAREHFLKRMQESAFAALSVARKTYDMYGCGYFVPLHRIALWTSVVPSERLSKFSDLSYKRQSFLERLMERVVTEGRLGQTDEYKGSFPGFNIVLNCDVLYLQNGLSLYSEGRKILQEDNTQTRSNQDILSGNSHPEVLRYLQNHDGHPCKEEALQMEILSSRGHEHRDLYRAIVWLRSHKKKCIVHDDLRGTFTLFSRGVREVKRGHYERYLWRFLDSENLVEVDASHTYMHLSDVGYNPILLTVEHILELKRIIGGFEPKLLKQDRRMDRALFKRKVFSVVLRERCLQAGDYYKDHPEVRKSVSPEEMKTLRSYWSLYHRIMYDQDITIVDDVGRFLNQQKGIFVLDDMATFLCTRTTLHKSGMRADTWRCLSSFMRSGYAGNIKRNGVSFSWHREAERVTEKREGLYEALLAVPEYCDVGFATFDLHKQGYMHIGPWDVYRLMDILIAGGVREGPFSDEGPQQMWQGARKDISPSVAQNTQRRQWLEEAGVLQAVRNGERFDVDDVLQDIRWIGEADPFFVDEAAKLTDADGACELNLGSCQDAHHGDDDCMES